MTHPFLARCIGSIARTSPLVTLTASVSALLWMPSPSALAQAPDAAASTTQPSDASAGDGASSQSQQDPRRRFGPGMRERGLRDFFGGDFRRSPVDPGPAKQEPPTAEEWNEISEFAKQNLPNRWKMYTEIVSARGEDAPVVKTIKQRIAVRYRNLQRSRTDNSDFYEKALQHARQEDDVWGAVRDLKNDPENDAKRVVVRDKVQSLMMSILEERAHRLEDMRAALEWEEARLSRDRENIDSLIDGQMAAMVAEQPGGEGGRMPRPFGGGGREGGGPGERPRRDRESDRPRDGGN